MKLSKYLLILICFLALSCKTKQILVTETITKVDTFKLTRTEKIFEAVHDTTTIENPCDSLGILKSFHSKIIIPRGKIEIKSLRGKIVATVNLDSIKSVYDSKYRSNLSQSTKISEKVITKEVVPLWAILTIIFETFIILGYIYLKVMKPL